jgi:hypothetical protein
VSSHDECKRTSRPILVFAAHEPRLHEVLPLLLSVIVDSETDFLAPIVDTLYYLLLCLQPSQKFYQVWEVWSFEYFLEVLVIKRLSYWFDVVE